MCTPLSSATRHRLAFVDPEFRIFLAEADGRTRPLPELGKAERRQRCSVEAFAFCQIAYRDGDVVDHWIPRKDDQAGAPDLMSL
jgi:hypothetical protein